MHLSSFAMNQRWLYALALGPPLTAGAKRLASTGAFETQARTAACANAIHHQRKDAVDLTTRPWGNDLKHAHNTHSCLLFPPSPTSCSSSFTKGGRLVVFRNNKRWEKSQEGYCGYNSHTSVYCPQHPRGRSIPDRPKPRNVFHNLPVRE